MRSIITTLLLLSLSLTSLPADAAPYVPEPLEPWAQWVLAGEDEAICARLGDQPLCRWPGRLALVLNESGGSFTLDVRADAATEMPLPGDTTSWPRDLKNGGSNARLGPGPGPTVELAAGNHRITGSFVWSRLPESLTVPPEIGLVALSLRGVKVPNPRRDKDGLLWLQGGAKEKTEEDQLGIEVHRRINDGVPVIVTTRLTLRVSGRSREVNLGPPLLPDTLATSLSSSLPARLDKDGTLQVQLRPGEWVIEVSGRSAAPVLSLAAPAADAPWPAEETWVFQGRPNVRSVRVDGAPGVDPARTSLPEDWRSLPAWRVARGTELQFVELRRGDAQPPPDRLGLQRKLWLSLDGKEFAVLDDIRGSLFEGGRMELLRPGKLGRTTVRGQDQLITVDGESGGGVEVRNGTLKMRATSTWARESVLPAVGWNRDAQELATELQLPPGWRLLAASGVDEASGSWLEQWTLMDLFLVLLISLAVGRLTTRPWGLLTLALLLISWQERGALQGEWILLLIPLGLLKVLPEGFVKRGISIVRWLVVLGLATQTVAFAWSASRTALFPQISGDAGSAIRVSWSSDKGDAFEGMGSFEAPNIEMQQNAPMETDEAFEESAIQRKVSVGVKQVSRANNRSTSYSSPKSSTKRASRLDPQAVVQTGPGLPQWSWEQYKLRWNGPVSSDHEMRLWMTSPWINGLLGLLCVVGTILLLLLLADPRRTQTTSPQRASGSTASLAFLGLCGITLMLALPRPAEAQVLPDPALLGELKTRLLARPDCEPHCAKLAQLTIEAKAEGLRIEAQVHTEALTPWQLPGPDSAWVPRKVLLNGEEVVALHRSHEGFLSIRLPPGVHTVVMSGPAQDEVGLQFPGAPKVLTFTGEGWTIAGYRPDAPPPGSVQLSRARSLNETSESPTQSDDELAPWLQVRRELDLGVPWLVHNELRRLGGGQRAVLARVPLLPGESVTSSGIPVENGEAIVSLEPGETVRRWDSTLLEAETLSLTSPEDRPWTEVWSLDCSPIWNCAADGLSPTRHLASGRWLPRWEPWPGESLNLTLRRPPPAVGVTTTIDHVKFSLTSGRRLLESTVNMSLRSSQGGEHSVTLPPGATLRSFQLDNRDHPAQPNKDSLVFAVEPGAHTVVVRWSQEAESGLVITAPPVDLGVASSNIEVEWELPDHRWVLWTWGPRWGPVVTMWQYILVLLLAAFLLARLAPTPLKFHDWFLLGLGLTQIPHQSTVFIVLWLIALSFRGRKKPGTWWRHDLAQITILGMTLLAMALLYLAVYRGLVADPDLGVRGAGSYGQSLHWFADTSGAALPTPGVLWLPVWTWRVAMLLWSLWLASRLLQWFRWGWEQFSVGGLWTTPPFFRSAPAIDRNSVSGSTEQRQDVREPVVASDPVPFDSEQTIREE